MVRIEGTLYDSSPGESTSTLPSRYVLSVPDREPTRGSVATTGRHMQALPLHIMADKSQKDIGAAPAEPQVVPCATEDLHRAPCE